LEYYPTVGKIVPELQDELIRELIIGSYGRVVFQIINDARLDVFPIHHCSGLIGNTYDFPNPED